MNEILRKRIEDKAADYADNLYPEFFPQYRTAEAAFEAGAEFALSHQWISVDEALPEYEEDVLALIGGAPVIAKGYHVRAGLRYNTHWMSIPKFKNKKQ